MKNEENGKQPSQEKDQTIGVEEKENEEATELPSNKKTDEVYGNFINSLRLPALTRRINIYHDFCCRKSWFALFMSTLNWFEGCVSEGRGATSTYFFTLCFIYFVCIIL